MGGFRPLPYSIFFGGQVRKPSTTTLIWRTSSAYFEKHIILFDYKWRGLFRILCHLCAGNYYVDNPTRNVSPSLKASKARMFLGIGDTCSCRPAGTLDEILHCLILHLRAHGMKAGRLAHSLGNLTVQFDGFTKAALKHAMRIGKNSAPQTRLPRRMRPASLNEHKGRLIVFQTTFVDLFLYQYRHHLAFTAHTVCRIVPAAAFH